MRRAWTPPLVVSFSMGLIAGILLMVMLLFLRGLDAAWLTDSWVPLVTIGVMAGGLLGVVATMLPLLLDADGQDASSPPDIRDSYGVADGDVPALGEMQKFLREQERKVPR